MSSHRGMCWATVLFIGLVAGPAWSWLMPVPAPGVRQDAAYMVPVYNEDQLKGQWKQFKGELKKQWADLTDDDLLYIEGRKDKLEGKIQERYGDRKEEVKQWVDEWFEKHPEEQRHR